MDVEIDRDNPVAGAPGAGREEAGFAGSSGESLTMAANPWWRGRRLVTMALLLPAVCFLTVWFIVPMARLLDLSLSDPQGSTYAYREILGNEVYRRVFLNTLILSVNVTLICIVIAYPTAYILSRLKGVALALLFYCVLFPFLTSVLVRTFSWMLLLERSGPINRLLMFSRMVDHPVQLLFNNTGVYIGMVHVLLPYAILPMYAAMVAVDERLLLASEGLGASPLKTFLGVYLPLTFPGAAAGAAFVFLLALGFFITPTLLGGLNNLTVAMLIDLFVSERLVWSLAAAASFCLLAIIILLLLTVSRFLNIGRFLVTR
jgi:putative spermidine/putrescine transport system permease protein